MADWTAITGIIVAGAVGPGVGGYIAYRLMGREHAFARDLDDRKELRQTLDEATQAMLVVTRRLGIIRAAFITHGWKVRRDAREAWEQFQAAGQEVDRMAGRLDMRLGKASPIALSYHAAVEATIAASRAIGLAGDMQEDADLRETWDTLEESQGVMLREFDAFLAAAFTRVGVRSDG